MHLHGVLAPLSPHYPAPGLPSSLASQLCNASPQWLGSPQPPGNTQFLLGCFRFDPIFNNFNRIVHRNSLNREKHVQQEDEAKVRKSIIVGP